MNDSIPVQPERQDVLVLKVEVPKEGGVRVSVDTAVLQKIMTHLGAERAAQATSIIAILATEGVPRHHAVYMLAGLISALTGAAGGHYDNALAIAREHGLTADKLATLFHEHFASDTGPKA